MEQFDKDPAFKEVFEMAITLGISYNEIEFCLNELSVSGRSSATIGKELRKAINNHLEKKA